MNNQQKKRIQERKEREKEQRRQVIIEAAKKLFISKGFEDTKMDEIAMESELSKGSLYNYFQEKEDLYLAVAVIALRKLNDSYEDIDLTSKSDIERILSPGYCSYRFSKENPNLYKIAIDIRSKAYFLNIKKKEIDGVSLNRNEEEMKFEITRYQQFVINPIKEALDNKSIRNDLTANFIGLSLISLTSGLIERFRDEIKTSGFYGINSDDIIKVVFEWVTEGLKPNKQEKLEKL